MSDNSDNLREYSRLPKEVKIEVSELTYPLPTEPSEIALSKDIGPKGICFSSTVLFEPKTVLTITVHLAGWQRHKKNLASKLDDSELGKPLTALAEVIWSKKAEAGAEYEIGIKFLDIHDDDFQALKKALLV